MIRSTILLVILVILTNNQILTSIFPNCLEIGNNSICQVCPAGMECCQV